MYITLYSLLRTFTYFTQQPYKAGNTFHRYEKLKFTDVK